jgi:rhodanese-related sulfurtransferase
LKAISPERAAELIRAGAVLVDVRESEEHARERIPGARHHALSTIDSQSPARQGDEVLIFHCKSGGRTNAAGPRLAKAASCEAYVLEGGIEAWKKAGLPVAAAAPAKRQSIGMMRQVQIVAGSLVLLAALLGFLVAPGFYAVAALVGAGLIFAGVSGICSLARILSLMPWNRPARAPSVSSTR